MKKRASTIRFLLIRDTVSNRRCENDSKELQAAAKKNSKINHGILIFLSVTPLYMLKINNNGINQSVLTSLVVVATASAFSPYRELVAITDEVSCMASAAHNPNCSCERSRV